MKQLISRDRKSTRLNSSHMSISYAVFCWKKKRRVFSRIEFAGPEVPAEPGDRVLRAYPKRGAEQEYRDVLVELTPDFDIRRLVVTYPFFFTKAATTDLYTLSLPDALPI